jgi:hypothetical protein
MVEYNHSVNFKTWDLLFRRAAPKSEITYNDICGAFCFFVGGIFMTLYRIAHLDHILFETRQNWQQTYHILEPTLHCFQISDVKLLFV